MISFENINVIVAPDPSCGQDASMFKAWACDLTNPDAFVRIPFWLDTGTGEQCVRWGTADMTRDTAVYLAKEAVWAKAFEFRGLEVVQPFVPPDFFSGNWDCNTAWYALDVYNQMAAAYGAQPKSTPVGLDPIFFAYLLTLNGKMQQLGAGVAAKALPQPAVASLVVPPWIQGAGGAFVPLPDPTNCPASPQLPGTTPGGTTPGTPGVPGTGYEPVGAKEEGKTSYLLPALAVGGVAAAVIAVAIAAKESPQPSPTAREGYSPFPPGREGYGGCKSC